MGVSESHIREWQAMMERRLAALAEQIPPPPPRPVLPEARNRPLIGKLTSALSRSGSATMEIYTTGPGTLTATGKTVTIYDFGQIPATIQLPIGAVVSVDRFGGYWKLIDFDCDASEPV